MKKVGLIAVFALSAVLFVGCSSSSPVSRGYFGVSNQKMNVQAQKEFKKPKHNSIKRCSTKVRN